MQSRDVLADVVDLLRVHGAVTAHVRAHAPWGLSLHRAPGATFHAVTGGTCWVRVKGQAAREVHAGGVVLMPTGAAHVVASSSAGPSRPWDHVVEAVAPNAGGEIVLAGSGGSTQLICASYFYDREVAHPLVSLLPPVLVVEGEALGDGSPLHSALRLLRHELTIRGPGWGMVVNRLIDVLFVQVIRAWVSGRDDGGTSWLRALRDPIIARVLTVMHADPAAEWTLDLLAGHANLSRATLTRRFRGLGGRGAAGLSHAVADGAGGQESARDGRCGGDHRAPRGLSVGVRVLAGVLAAQGPAAGAIPGRDSCESRILD